MYSISPSVHYDIRESFPIHIYMTMLSRIYTYIYMYICITAGKWQKCNLVSGMASVGQQHGLAMNWVDRPRTSADERDVVCSPRCRDCVSVVAGFGRFCH